MAEQFMSPRSYTYSGGDLVPYRDRPSLETPTSVSIGTEPSIGQAPTQNGGFWTGLDRLAGAILPIVEAANAFKQGYQTGYPLPGRGVGDNRMAGDRFIFQVLEDMRQRNESAAERARTDRETARKEEARNRLILAGVESGKIDIKDALKILGGEVTKAPNSESGIGLEPPMSDVYTDDILDNEPEAWGAGSRR
jgi:hypothetical protein